MLKKIFILFLMASAFLACEENGELLKLNSEITPNVLEPLTADNFVLDRELASENFQEFKWSEPDFGFQPAVAYTLQMDVSDNNFATAVDVLSTTEIMASMTVGDFNKKLLDLGLAPDESSSVELRVRSVVDDNVAPVYSTSQKISVTPYATDFPPYYMIGDATGGWDLAKAVEIISIAPSTYETTAEFTNGGKFRFFASPSWDAVQYNWATFEGGNIDSKLENGMDSDNNFKFIGTTGWYKITVDVKSKSIVMEAVEKPALYMIGAAIQGWDLAKAVEMARLKDNLYQVTTSFTSGETFRFFTKPDWSAGTINYPYFAGGEVDPLFVNAGDSDSNFKFIGTTGLYTITVDLNALTVVMEDPGDTSPIYMIGDATGGWDLALAVEVAKIGSQKYETIADFTNGLKFRFFATADWGAEQYNWSTFEGGSVDSELEDAQDSDGNFLFVGATGSYKITVDIPNKTIVMEPQ